MSFTLVLDIHVNDIHISAMTELAQHLSLSGTTDADLARRVDCDRSMITKIKLGKATPSLRLALAISRETGIAVGTLLPSTPNKESAA